MNYLGNKTGAGTASIVDFVNRVGSIGEVAGFSADKVAAIGASLIEQGMAAEVAATGAKKYSLLWLKEKRQQKVKLRCMQS